MQRDAAALKAALADLEQRHLKRTRRVGVAPGLVNFCSNDYLGLDESSRGRRAPSSTAASKHGVGSGASHLVTGHGLEHEALEEELAAFTGREKALVFSTGYMANMGVIGALADQNAGIVSDKLNHASLIDGCRLSGAEVRRYRHGDAAHAAELLVDARKPRPGWWSPTVCSAWTATSRRLPELARARARARTPGCIVDDAHGLGVIGATGRGSCEQFALSARRCAGADRHLRQGVRYLRRLRCGRCRSHRFADAESAHLHLHDGACRRRWPRPRARRCASASARAGGAKRRWPCRSVSCAADRARHRRQRRPRRRHRTTIVPVILGEAARALAVSRALESAGFSSWPFARRPYRRAPRGCA